MSTFKKMNDMKRKFNKIPSILFWLTVAFGISIAASGGTFLIFLPIYILIVILLIRRRKKLNAALLACKAEIESDPVLVAEYHADKNQHDFDETVRSLRDQIKSCYHNIEMCEKNGQYQMAAKYRGDISTLESKLRQLGC